MRQFEGQLLDEHDWSQVQPGVEVKLVAHPDLQGKEQYVIARSVDRAEKESVTKKHLHCARMLLRSAWHANGFYGRSVSAKGLIEGDSQLEAVRIVSLR